MSVVGMHLEMHSDEASMTDCCLKSFGSHLCSHFPRGFLVTQIHVMVATEHNIRRLCMTDRVSGSTEFMRISSAHTDAFAACTYRCLRWHWRMWGLSGVWQLQPHFGVKTDLSPNFKQIALHPKVWTISPGQLRECKALPQKPHSHTAAHD